MKAFRSQSQPARRGTLSSLQSFSSSAMSPLSTASISLATLLMLTIPACTGAPADLQQATIDHRQLLRQIDAVCSSYLSADLKLLTSDILGDLCVLMLVQKTKELRVQENNKRFLFHHSRPQSSVLSKGADLQGPRGIESRGYFLYRPRNGRSLEYE
uniref:Neuromedin U n=1 Tax=Nothobranchius rachovii TaxID=451742 RepID=A0A1A8QJA1_9TELE